MRLREFFSLRTVKYIIVIVVALAAGVFLGRFITNYETRYLLSREYCGSYRGIDVYKCGEINAENFIGHAHMLEQAPEAIVECCTDMYFVGGEISIPASGGGIALGLTQDSTVYISTDSFDVDVVYHELFHTYDNVNGGISESEEFLNIFYREQDNVFVEVIDSDDHSAEFFAAAGAQYLLEPETLKLAAPKTFDYINGLLGCY